VSQIPDLKHGRAIDIDYVSFLGLLGNYVAKMLSGGVFGIFENVTPKKFSPGRFRGLFRDLHGSSQPFIRVLQYEGTTPFSDADVFWACPSAGVALNLSPMYLWGLNNFRNPDEDSDLYEYDNCTKDKYSYKAIQVRESAFIDGNGDLGQLWQALMKMRIEDPYIPMAEGLAFDGVPSSS
jgi:hypothetical protein